MNGELLDVKTYGRAWLDGWNRFWFLPADPLTLGLLRLLAGAVIFYTHLAWTFELETFFGSRAIIPAEHRALLNDGMSFTWSHFDWLPSALLWPAHLSALVVMAMFMVGFKTRVTSVITACLVISYANRATGAQFGLDQINAFLAMYLAMGPSGESFSVDRWLKARAGIPLASPCVMANLSLRLIQVHMCVVYFFAGAGKLLGETWWEGTAIWGAVANLEYQTLDLTWLASELWLVNILTWSTLFWEVSYPFLIWPKLTRPLWILMAVGVHLGIGLAMGMMTFGLIMVVGNFAFLTPAFVRRWAAPLAR
ncbi:MAG: HTTM domain-containing protein [Pirellulaceae bacterium]|nr:HTTM domain-containing protein [Pirellulaceae bacterium]